MNTIDCSYLDQKEPEWISYFGNQRRFANFVVELVKEMNLPNNAIFAETNSGSHAISLAIRKQLNLKTLSNDISHYSYAIGKALNVETNWEPSSVNNNFLEKTFGNYSLFTSIDEKSTKIETPVEAGALGMLLAYNGGYDFDFENSDKNFSEKLYLNFQNLLNKYAYKGAEIYKSDLMYFLSNNRGNVVYMDFAWPWKDGREVKEYGHLADICSSALTQKEEKLELWNHSNIINKVLDACSLAVTNFDYVILSNQSSNYPTSEILESALFSTSAFKVINMRRLTVPAQDVDNRGLDNWFIEYQYVLIK